MVTARNRSVKKMGWCKLLLACVFYCPCYAQSTSYNFRHLTVNDGLSNGVIKSVAQDKYGYMWLATGSGVCRYNGYSVKVFLHSDKDALSAPDNLPSYIVCDKKQTVWIAFESGLCRYNYTSNSFELQPQTKGIAIDKMVAGENDILYCVTRKGLLLFHTSDGGFTPPDVQNKGLLQRHTSDVLLTKKNVVYVATDTGLVVYQPALHTACLKKLAPLANEPAEKLATDEKGNLWIGYGQNGNLLLQADSSFTHYQVYKNFLYGRSDMTGSRITNIFTDKKNRIWVATSRDGICRYNNADNSFERFLDNPLQPLGLSSYHITAVFQDQDGFIWAGTEGYGVNYFDPDNNLFHAIMPDNKAASASSDHWYRAAAEDKEGNLWMGGMNGLVCYTKQSHTYSLWQNKRGSENQLYSNSIRSLLYDSSGCLWIGTAEGLNRYHPATKHMDFFSQSDSVPPSFYWSLMQDHNNNIWIGCREGLFRYSYATRKFEHFAGDSLFSPFHTYNILCLFEDSHQRIWLGCYSKGVVMIDRKNNIVKHWMKNKENPSFISNNIKSFTEDKKGTIWIAANDGLTAYTNEGNFVNYNQENGLQTLNVCALQTDDHDRIWIGSGNGLFVLDSTRKEFTAFTVKDGLPSAAFNEQSAFKTRQGDFIYPTLQGFITFNPGEYKENTPQRKVYISAVNVFNKKFSTAVNPEEVKNLQLAANENFFSLELSSPNYNNPQSTWFAYKLEPFDKDWIYTKERLANYTNVPGGKYVFHYKASANKGNWNTPEKTIAINIATLFYHTTFFWFLIAFMFVLLVYSLYIYRIRQSRKIYALQSKTQLLEKEKALVMYENLKQQLNPHFLFNSLTSLRSLIRIDRQTAADFLDKISMNYRYILKSSESELVLLKDELLFAQTYVDMLQTRFGSGLCVQMQTDGEDLDKKIVPVTIQNLIDNAIKHNALDADEPLVIHIFTEDNYLVVANNLRRREDVETSNRYGLPYLISLYKFLDNRPVLINKSESHFTVKIPLI